MIWVWDDEFERRREETVQGAAIHRRRGGKRRFLGRPRGKGEKCGRLEGGNRKEGAGWGCYTLLKLERLAGCSFVVVRKERAGRASDSRPKTDVGKKGEFEKEQMGGGGNESNLYEHQIPNLDRAA